MITPPPPHHTQAVESGFTLPQNRQETSALFGACLTGAAAPPLVGLALQISKLRLLGSFWQLHFGVYDLGKELAGQVIYLASALPTIPPHSPITPLYPGKMFQPPLQLIQSIHVCECLTQPSRVHSREQVFLSPLSSRWHPCFRFSVQCLL